jgi:hypothetical protein
VVAAVVLVRPEGDSDLHVVLQSSRNHMITEAPSPSCDRRATAYRRRQMRVARNHVRLCARARVTGVASSTSTTVRPGSRRTRSSCTRSCVSPVSPVRPVRMVGAKGPDLDEGLCW